MEWVNWEITKEPLAILAADDPSTCAIYAKEKDILIRKGGNVLKGLPIKRNTSFD
jgi:hypothetical protein